MKFSKHALNDVLGVSLSTEQLVSLLNQAGLEVDSVEPVFATFSGVVIAEVMSVKQHPNADKLKFVEVRIDSDPSVKWMQVVCGAPNIRENLKVPFATVGAVLTENFKIKRAKLRGVTSNGMICSKGELGFQTEFSDGIWELPQDLPVGLDLSEYLHFPDELIEIDVTPNRSDCLSIVGIAREICAMRQISFSAPIIEPILPAQDDTLGVTISVSKGNVHYYGRVIHGLKPDIDSPVWLTEYLRRAGVRSVHPVVDITNYVMLFLGQPMHAFDLEELEGDLLVSDHIGSLSECTVLSGETIRVTENTLIISDSEKIVALAGIMGSLETSVSNRTVAIFLESAYFSKNLLSGKAREYNLHTEASHRFERGVSPELARDAIELATKFVLSLLGGIPGPVTHFKTEAMASDLPVTIELRYAQIKRLLGLEIPFDRVEKMLQLLHLKINCVSDQQKWRVEVPAFRFDLRLEVDLIEEIARLYGYDAIVGQRPQVSLISHPKSEKHLSEQCYLDNLRTLGYSEIITYSFVDPAVHQLFSNPDEVICLNNPISKELSEMRTSLWPGLLQVVNYNQAHQMFDLKLFEQGVCFKKTASGRILEKEKLAGLWVGAVGKHNWAYTSREVDFFDLKGDLENLLALTKQSLTYVAEEMTAFHPGQSAKILAPGAKQVGVLGLLHPSIEKVLNLKGPIVLFELDRSLFSEAKLVYAQLISKLPRTCRDLSLLVNKDKLAADLQRTVRFEAGDAYQDCIIFDLYQGKSIADDKKSIALSVYLKSTDKNFTEQEINSIMERILHALKSKHGAKLRERSNGCIDKIRNC